MSRPYAHPAMYVPYQQLGHAPYQQLGFWDEFRENTLDPWVNETLEDVGLDQKEIDRIKSEAGGAFDKRLAEEQKKLVQQITGSGGTAAPAPPKTTIADTVKNIEQSAVVKAIPGGIYTIAGVGLGLLAILVLRK